jgi:hypothetical protein
MRGEGQDRTKFSKRLYEYIASQSELAEIFLDSCGAKENRAWFFLRELVAAIRCLGKVCYVLRYLELRVSSYEIADQETWSFR